MGSCVGGTEWAPLGVLVGFPVFWGSGSGYGPVILVWSVVLILLILGDTRRNAHKCNTHTRTHTETSGFGWLDIRLVVEMRLLRPIFWILPG